MVGGRDLLPWRALHVRASFAFEFEPRAVDLRVRSEGDVCQLRLSAGGRRG